MKTNVRSNGHPILCVNSGSSSLKFALRKRGTRKRGTLLKIDTFSFSLSLPLVSPTHDSNDTIRLLWPGTLSSSPVTKFFLFYPRAGHFRVSSRGEESQGHLIELAEA
jgi:hypothetical protein